MYFYIFKKIPLSSSLLLVLNEDGQVLNYKIVPNDRREHVETCLNEIWTEPDAQKIYEVVYSVSILD